ncbi:MAG: S41 family peptidase [Alistipes sp.]|jgi:carboxyl-terminal processing protease|nr:S41 family peptidase [Alistipes sp.]
MRKKLKYSLWGLAAAGVVALTTAAYTTDFRLGQNVELAVNVMRSLYLYYVDPVDPDALGKGAAAGMVAALDPYTELIHADDSDQFELMTTGKYGGIGAIIRARGEWVQVAEPYEGSPADRAGLEIGDTFLEIDRRDARGMTTATVSSILKGEPGTNVTVRVRKFHTGDEVTLSIRREVIALPSVPYFGMVADSVGYIRHTEFTDGSADEVRGALDALKKQGAKALVLDYRANGGGIMQEAVKIVGMFVPRGTEVVAMRGRGEGTTKQYLTENEPLELEMPLAVLVDGYSASAAEIVAGAMQDLDRGVVVGQRTFGKGLVQSTLPAGFGSYIKITTAKYYIPSGRCIQAIDYSHQTGNEESAGTGAPSMERRERAIPDSLISEFRTAGGRRVYDGGGVMPDLRLEPEYSSRFAVVAYTQGVIDDFADEWSRTYRGKREIKPDTFSLSDDDWNAFVSFAAGKNLGYESLSGQALDYLRTVAEHERYLTPEVDSLIGRLRATMRDDNKASMTLYRDELADLIEDAIILRSHYSRGVTRHNLKTDKALAEALKVLNDHTRYREILTSQDTLKK